MKKIFKKVIKMEITDIIYHPPTEREGDETAIHYNYGSEKDCIEWVDPNFGEIISNLTGLKIKKHGDDPLS